MTEAALYQGATVATLYDRAIRRYADHEAIVQGDVRITYRQFGEQVSRFIQLFKSYGLGRGQGLAVLSGNRPEVIAVMAACQYLGMRYTPLHPMGSIDDHRFVLEDSEAAALVVDADRYPETERLLPSLQLVLTFGVADFGVSAAELLPKFAPAPLIIEARSEDVSQVLYTGGTTGRPKGVVVSHRMWINNMKQIAAEREYPLHPRVLAATPISHASGGNIAPVQLKGGVIFLQDGFTPVSFMEIVQKERINSVTLVPTAIYALLDHPRLRDYDLSSLELIAYTGAPISPTRIQQALDHFGPIFCQGYGQTECQNITYLSKSDHLGDPRKLESCGLPIMGFDVAVLNEALEEVGPGEVGEVCVRGPNVMDGYWKRPEETAEVFRGDWLHTGDLATRDADGYLFLVGRAKDMIISGGFNVYPREVEDVLEAHPAVAMCAVIGVPDEKWGEAVTAFVVSKDGAAVDVSELKALVRSRKGPVYAPKTVHKVSALPMTAYNKIDKKALRDRFWDRDARQIG
ncbi:AMP-binding protein [Phenylobacterium sp.]|uniref:AMP-binding protein n=1 Tax=Phenylobacterium sp. TaxID=1871053 RepID=UPI00301E5D0A